MAPQTLSPAPCGATLPTGSGTATGRASTSTPPATPAATGRSGRPSHPARRSRALTSAALVLAALTVACQDDTATGPLVHPAAPPPTDVVVLAANLGAAPMAVSLVLGGLPHPIGVVAGGGEEQFSIGQIVAEVRDEMRFHVTSPTGQGDVWTSEPLALEAGDRVELTIRNHVSGSSLVVLKGGELE